MADRWDSSLYDDRHSFVWRFGAGLVELLQPKLGERILDLGCGTGHLTAKIAESGALVTGIDSSVSMVAQARQNFPALKFRLEDARDFRFNEPFDAVFSNAALHWIHDAEAVVQTVARALSSGGRFVLEMGVRGNISHIREATESVLREAGKSPRCPWYFPSLGEYSAILERCGFEVRIAETFARSPRLEHPERGMREWLEMFAGAYFVDLMPEQREQLYAAIEERLRPILYHDGAWWADYRRLRVEAVVL